jgi:hypothetical protein
LRDGSLSFGAFEASSKHAAVAISDDQNATHNNAGMTGLLFRIGRSEMDMGLTFMLQRSSGN